MDEGVAQLVRPPLALDFSHYRFIYFGLFIVFAVIAATALPLATYTLSLACFGLAHVLSEFRYLDLRFSDFVGKRLLREFGFLLFVIIVIRGLAIAGVLSIPVAITVELAIVSILIFTILNRTNLRLMVMVSGLSLAIAALFWPIETLALFAILHNLTPLGFLAEALPVHQRRKVLAVGTVVFIGLPVLIASGILQKWFALSGILNANLSLFAVGGIVRNLSAYIPHRFQAEPWAISLFSAVVFAQIMHYAMTIYILPRMLTTSAPSKHSGIVAWPSRAVMRWGLAGIAVLAAASFAIDFTSARAFYSLAAAIHAWAEIPLLLLLFPRLTRFKKTVQPMQ